MKALAIIGFVLVAFVVLAHFVDVDRKTFHKGAELAEGAYSGARKVSKAAVTGASAAASSYSSK